MSVEVLFSVFRLFFIITVFYGISHSYFPTDYFLVKLVFLNVLKEAVFGKAFITSQKTFSFFTV